jgi:hypothetical protein
MDLNDLQSLTRENIDEIEGKYGVYAIFARDASEVKVLGYIGGTGYGSDRRTFRARLKEHHHLFLKETHNRRGNERFGNHVRAHGMKTVFFSILESFKEKPSFEVLQERETFWIGLFGAFEDANPRAFQLANAGRSAEPAKGHKFTDEQKEEMRRQRKAEWAATPEAARKARVQAMLQARTGEEISQNVRNRYANMTEDQMIAFGKAVRAGRMAVPKEVRASIAKERFKRLSASSQKAFLTSLERLTPEELSERGRKAAAALTLEQHVEKGKRAWETRVMNDPFIIEELSNQIRRVNDKRTHDEYVAIGKKGSATMGPVRRKEAALKAMATMGREGLRRKSQKAIVTRRKNLLETTGSDKIPGSTNRIWSAGGKRRIGDANKNRTPEQKRAAEEKKAARRLARKLAGEDPSQIRFQKLKDQVLELFPKEGLTNEGVVDFLKPLGWSARGLKLLVKDGVLNPIAGFGPDSRYFLSSVDPECFRGDPSMLPPPGRRAKITEEQAREVFRMRIAGDPLTKIGDQIGISAACVRQMLKGRTWKRVYLEFTSNEKNLVTRDIRHVQFERLKSKISSSFPEKGLSGGELVIFLKDLGYSEGIIARLVKEGIIEKIGGHKGRYLQPSSRLP